MSWFKDLRLFFKIFIIVALGVSALAVNLLLGVSGMTQTQERLERIETQLYEMAQLATLNSVLLERSDELFSQAVSFSDIEPKDSAVAALASLKENIQTLRKLDSSSGAKLDHLAESIGRYEKISIEIVSNLLGDSPDFDRLAAIASEKTSVFQESNNMLVKYKDGVDTRFKEVVTETSSANAETLRYSIITGVVLVSLLLVVAVSVARSISNTASSLGDSLKELSSGDGDLRKRVPLSGRDELGKVAYHFNNFMDILSSSIASVIDVSKPLAHSSSQLLDTAERSRSLLNAQAAATQNAQDAMAEFRNSIQEITQSASLAQTEVRESEKEIDDGLHIVEKTVSNSVAFGQQIDKAANSVKSLAEDTNAVNSILDVIQSIAEQTNLLALNAAIEAARAGEQGRGFAVVADEVRSLASRTGEATKEIFEVLEKLRVNASNTVDLMEKSQSMSGNNVDYAKSTGEALERIRTRFDAIASINDSVASATEEQSLVIDGVVTRTQEMNHNVSQCVDSFAQLDSISKELGEAAESLTKATKQFHL